MPSDRCPCCNLPPAPSLPAPAGTCGARVQARCDCDRFGTAPCARHKAGADCRARTVAWRARALATEVVLREVEWGGRACEPYSEWPCGEGCPSCKWGRDAGHAPDCRLAAALAVAESPGRDP